ncbi:MAG: hypothetical protein LBI92_11630 [Azoarcus sp.]|jgi:hypothetical protein|nr:hypothetical protein [Azoarcus sp.]
MFEKSFRIIHGWIEDIQSGGERRDGYVLKLHQKDSAESAEIIAARPDWPMKIGNEVSIALFEDNPALAVAIVDHTAEQGFALPRGGRDWRPDIQDSAILSAVFGVIWLAVGWVGLPVFVVTVALYWFCTSWLPERKRQWMAARIAHALDKAYFVWSRTRSGAGG